MKNMKKLWENIIGYQQKKVKPLLSFQIIWTVFVGKQLTKFVLCKCT